MTSKTRREIVELTVAMADDMQEALAKSRCRCRLCRVLRRYMDIAKEVKVKETRRAHDDRRTCVGRKRARR